MTPEQLAAAKSIVQHAAVNSLETDEVMLLGHALQEIDRLRSAPVEVEVPTWSTDAFCAHVGLEGAFSAGDIRVFFAGAKACHGWISKEVHPIPSDRVLKEGEREELEILRQVAKLVDDKRNAQWEKRGAGPCQRVPDEIDNLLCDWHEIRAQREFNALRSATNEGE